MLLADVRRDYVLTHFSRLADLSMDELESLYAGLEQTGLEEVRAVGIKATDIVFERAADMRYVGQEHAVALPVPAYVGNEEARAAISTAFHEAHQLRFAHSAPEEPTELVSLRVSVLGRIDKPELPRIAEGGSTPPADAMRATREVVLGDWTTPVTCAVIDRSKLLAGNVVSGPAVIEEAASSTLLFPGDRAVVNEFGHLAIELESQ
jgi:N-methylhydantoinase A